ncbi:MAG: rhombosortase [Candidatus Thiodiazotropha sp. (ex Epidulcina cf. delphinae)]|nr:rhombosortase [Candidatus Thiodiazotropha sp. (ex Epidulcina cf. delphinae)]
MRSAVKPLACPLAISLACLLFGLLPTSLVDSLQYHRTEIAAGEWWRLITGHLTHLGWGHLLMNLAGLWLIWGLFPGQYPAHRCIYRPALLMLGASLGLWLFSPEVVWYKGLSGMLHGLLCWALLRRIRFQPAPFILILAFLWVKLAWEQWFGPIPGSESLASGQVIVDAHLYGAVSGILLWSFELVIFAPKHEDSE